MLLSEPEIPKTPKLKFREGNPMRKTNEELDGLIAEQQEHISNDAGKVDVRRGHVAKGNGQLVRNREEAIKALESQKELSTVNLRAGL